MTTAGRQLVYQALDDVPRTVIEIWKRVDQGSSYTVREHLRAMVKDGRAVSFEEKGDKNHIVRKRYRRAPCHSAVS